MARTESGRSKSRREPEPAPPVAIALDGPKPTLASPQWKSARRLAINTLIVQFILMVFAFFVFHSSAVVAHGNETTFDRAVFTTVNASTLTGFRQTMGVREMRAAGVGGPVLLLILTLAGSMMSLTIGGLAACRILRMPHKPSQIIWAAVSCLLLTTLGGAAALAGTGRSVLEAIFQATCAFANSGLWLGLPPSTTEAATHLVLLPLAVLGGLGLPVLIEISDRAFGGPPISRHSRVALMLAGAFYLGGLIDSPRSPGIRSFWRRITCVAKHAGIMLSRGNQHAIRRNALPIASRVHDCRAMDSHAPHVDRRRPGGNSRGDQDHHPLANRLGSSRRASRPPCVPAYRDCHRLALLVCVGAVPGNRASCQQ